MKYVGTSAPSYSMPKSKRSDLGITERQNDPGPQNYYIPGAIEERAYETIRNIHNSAKNERISPSRLSYFAQGPFSILQQRGGLQNIGESSPQQQNGARTPSAASGRNGASAKSLKSQKSPTKRLNKSFEKWKEGKLINLHFNIQSSVNWA